MRSSARSSSMIVEVVQARLIRLSRNPIGLVQRTQNRLERGCRQVVQFRQRQGRQREEPATASGRAGDWCPRSAKERSRLPVWLRMSRRGAWNPNGDDRDCRRGESRDQPGAAPCLRGSALARQAAEHGSGDRLGIPGVWPWRSEAGGRLDQLPLRQAIGASVQVAHARRCSIQTARVPPQASGRTGDAGSSYQLLEALDRVVVVHPRRARRGTERPRDLLVVGSLLGPEEKHLALQPRQAGQVPGAAASPASVAARSPAGSLRSGRSRSSMESI